MADRSTDKFYRHTERGTVNVIYIPDNWPIDDDGDLLGYGSTRLVSNDSEIDVLWFSRSLLTEEISEAEAHELHPALFEHLDKIDHSAA